MAQSFGAAGVRDEIEKRVEAAWKLWEAHPQAGRLIRDVWPEVANEVWQCGRLFQDGYKVYRSKSTADKFRVAPFRCGKIPFCLPCTNAVNVQRTFEALDAFKLCTPKGEPVRLWHVVLMAPLTEDGQGWGKQASEDIGRFAKVCRRTLEDWWGLGVGGIMAYQDFGERPFAKRAPHFDILLNGYQPGPDKAQPLRRLALEDGGHRELMNHFRSRAHYTLAAGARDGNFDIKEVGASWSARIRVSGYSLRELVDLRKVEYEPDAGRVGWRSYREDNVDWSTPTGVKAWWSEYSRRVENGQALRRWFGTMARHDARSVLVRGFHGEDPHGLECLCNGCDEWQRLIGQWQDRVAAPFPGGAVSQLDA